MRLDGPVNGRSGVCRNLEVDMARMKRLGVACIVWLVLNLYFAFALSTNATISCLDDDELEFLGAPWPEYERCANRINIDVLRYEFFNRYD